MWIVCENVVNPEKLQVVAVLRRNGNIQECLLHVRRECHLVSSESCHYFKDERSEGQSRVQTIVKTWSAALGRCIIYYTELSSVLIKSDDLSVWQVVDLAYRSSFFPVHCMVQ